MGRLIDRLAARFGFVRESSRPVELVVFRDRSEMRSAGFSFDGTHPSGRHLRAWWPGAGIRGLCGMGPPARVTISEQMASYRTSEGRVGDILRARQKVWGDQAAWMELG